MGGGEGADAEVRVFEENLDRLNSGVRGGSDEGAVKHVVCIEQKRRNLKIHIVLLLGRPYTFSTTAPFFRVVIGLGLILW